jgi:hypothetical protein
MAPRPHIGATIIGLSARVNSHLPVHAGLPGSSLPTAPDLPRAHGRPRSWEGGRAGLSLCPGQRPCQSGPPPLRPEQACTPRAPSAQGHMVPVHSSTQSRAEGACDGLASPRVWQLCRAAHAGHIYTPRRGGGATGGALGSGGGGRQRPTGPTRATLPLGREDAVGAHPHRGSRAQRGARGPAPRGRPGRRGRGRAGAGMAVRLFSCGWRQSPWPGRGPAGRASNPRRP